MNAPDRTTLRIGAWRVDPWIDEISSDGRVVKLEPRTMRLLVCLAENADRVVSVQELLDKVWPDVIVTPDSVYQSVATLRRTLGEDTREPTYIANVPRRGYRMVASVDRSVAAPAPSPVDNSEDNAQVPNQPSRGWLADLLKQRPRLSAVAGVLLFSFSLHGDLRSFNIRGGHLRRCPPPRQTRQALSSWPYCHFKT